MSIDQSENIELLDKEVSYSDFVKLISEKPELLENNLIKTAYILKVLGRRPLFYHFLLKVLNENEEMSLSEIYRLMKINYGELFEGKIKAGSGLGPYLEHLEVAGILSSKENGHRIKWIPAKNNIILDISNKEYKTVKNPNLDDVVNCKLDIIVYNDESSPQDFDSKRLLQSLIKSDVSFYQGIDVLSGVIKRIELDENTKRNKRIKKNNLIEIIIEEMSKCNVDFYSINKFQRVVTSSPPYGVYVQDLDGPNYKILEYNKLHTIILEVLHEMITFDDISQLQTKQTLEIILRAYEVKKELQNNWKAKNFNYTHSLSKINSKYTQESEIARTNKDELERNKKIEEINITKKSDLIRAKNDFLKELTQEEIKEFKFYLIGKNEFEKIGNNIYLIIKKLGFKYVDRELVKLIIKQYIWDSGILQKKVANPREYAINEFNEGKKFSDLASVYKTNEDIETGVYNALMALNKFYSILFFAFRKIGSSSPFFALTKCATEVFDDRNVVKKLVELKIHDRYYDTMKLFKNNSTLIKVIQRGGCADTNISRDLLTELLLRTYQIKESTQTFIDNFNFENEELCSRGVVDA